MKQFEHGGFVYDSEGRLRNVLDFSANINPLGIADSVRHAIEKNLDGIVHYPDPSARRLKEAIAARYALEIENIAVFNGAAEFFYVFFKLLAPSAIYIPQPTFGEYERAARAAGLRVNFDSEEQNVVVCNPNNPAGELHSIDEILKLTAAHRVIVDESFIDFVGDEYSVKKFVARNENLIVVQSLTKIFAIPGLRLGFAVADRNVIKQLELGKDVWNVNSLAQEAGIAGLGDSEYLAQTRRWLAEERPYVVSRLRAIDGIEEVFEPSANFVLMKFETIEKAQCAIDRLKSDGILIRNCENFRGLDGRYLRMAIRLRAENDRLFDVLETLKSMT